MREQVRHLKAPSQLPLETRSHPHLREANAGLHGLRVSTPNRPPMGVGSCLVRGSAQGLQAECRPGQGRGLGLFHHPQPPRMPRYSCLEQRLGEAHECQAYPTLTVDHASSIPSSQTGDPECCREGQGGSQPWAPRSAHSAQRMSPNSSASAPSGQGEPTRPILEACFLASPGTANSPRLSHAPPLMTPHIPPVTHALLHTLETCLCPQELSQGHQQHPC